MQRSGPSIPRLLLAVSMLIAALAASGMGGSVVAQAAIECEPATSSAVAPDASPATASTPNVAFPESGELTVFAAASLTESFTEMGDAIMAKHKTREHSANKAFRSGIFAFEVRMAVLFVGLLTGQLAVAVVVIALGAAYTALGRLVMVYGKLAVN